MTQDTTRAALSDLRAIVQQAAMALEELQGPGFLIGGVMHHRIGLILPRLNAAIDEIAALAQPQQAAPNTRKPCTCDGAGRGPGRACVVAAGGRLGELWRCCNGLESAAPAEPEPTIDG
jgi:hypothetical protein